MIGRWLCRLLIFLPACTAAPAAAGGSDAPDDSVLTLPEVRVSAERAASEPRRRLPTAFVSDLRAGASPRALESISEILSQAAGVRVVQYGGLGSFSTVSLRGAPPGQVSVYLDGLPLTSAARGVVNLSDLPLTAVERVEVYRGLSPLDLGVATPGGAINLVTASSPGPGEVRVSRGAFDTWEARAGSGGRRGRFSGLVHVGYQGSAGDFRFWDDNSTDHESADDSMSIRVNNRFDATSALARLEVALPSGFRALARGNLFRKAQGIPGLGASPALGSRLALERSIGEIGFARGTTGAWPALRLRGYVERQRTRFRDTEGKLSLGRHHTDDRLGDEGVTLGLEGPTLPLGLSLRAAGSARRERASLHDALDGFPDPPESRRATAGVFLGLQLRPLGERVTLHAGRRWDRVVDHLRSLGVAGTTRRADVARELNSPQVGVRIAVLRGLELRANWADAQRVPDFLELFGNQGSVLGNPQLRPERGETWDAGAAWSRSFPGRLEASIEWAHHESRARDLIVYLKNTPSSVRAQNVSRARIRGEELSVRLEVPSGLSVSGSLTRQTAMDQGPAPSRRGKRLPLRPERQAYVRLDWTRGRLGAAADLHYIGDNYLDPYNSKRVPSRALVGAALSLEPLRSVRLVVEGKNLGDDRVADVGGFPLPGRSVFVSIQSRLGPARSTRDP